MGILGPRKPASLFAPDPADAGLVVERASGVKQFGGGAVAGMLGNTAVNFFALNLNTFTTPAGAALQGYQQQLLDIRGDWLYVDPLSSGGVRADFLTKQVGQFTQTVALVPGVVIKTPFNQIVVYRNPLAQSAYQIQPGTLGEFVPYGEPLLKLWFGFGECPFQSPTETRGASYMPSGVEVNTTASYSIGWQVTDGSIIRDAYTFVSKICVGAEVSVLVPNAVFLTTNGELVGRVGPSTVQSVTQSANLRADCSSSYKDVVVPRWAAIFSMRVSDVGTAVTNTFTNAVGSLILG